MEKAVNNRGDALAFARKNSDLLVAVGIVIILLVMIIPLPPTLLDILLSFNITFSIIILLTASYILQPLELSSFPSILLLATLFRLALNVASTRLILMNGNEGVGAAGKVISAFGQFVVGGNYAVGFIVFAVLVVINFAVITKGAGRIAEVAARFTLDAMPGKQMSIDADLNAGLIDDKEAKIRRKRISQEAEYYGAMDGASKFVRGDAIAGIIITLINIIGGFAIGVLQKGMSLSEAASNYTLLTVGDGLVTQIPALIVSTAAGVIVSRAAASEANLGEEITSQILTQPRAIAVAAAVLCGLALVPGLPTMPFLLLAAVAGGVAYTLFEAKKVEAERKKEVAAEEKKISAEPPQHLKPVDAISLEIGFGLLPLVDQKKNGELLDRIRAIRRQIAQDIGVVIPPVHIVDNIQLKPTEYSILLRGNEIARGDLMLGSLLAMDPGTAKGKIEGIATREPTYGLPAVWIKERLKEKAMTAGYTVVDPATVLVTHLSQIIRSHAHELLGRQEVQGLIDSVKESHPKVVEELIPGLMSLGAVGKVLQNLLREQIPVRDLVTILETLADWAPSVKDTDLLTEYVRQALSRTITKMYQTKDGTIPVLTLHQNLERALNGALQQSEHGGYLNIDPNLAEKIVGAVAKNLEKYASVKQQPVVVCSGRIRSHFKRLLDRFIPNVAVLSYNEIMGHVKIQSIGTVGLADAN
jgi:flagellar biosynthesis protein FlhA